MSEKLTYRLYAIPCGGDCIDRISAERFGRITSEYALIYTSGEAPNGAVTLTKEHAHLLTDGDRKWLRDCNMAIIAEEMKNREQELCGNLTEQLDVLEELLRAEAEKLNAKKDVEKHGAERTE